MVLESPEKDWLALSLVTGVGTQTLQKLSETFGSLSKIWQKSSDQLQQLSDCRKQWMFEVSRWKKG